MVTYDKILQEMRNDNKEDGSDIIKISGYTVDDIFDYLKKKEINQKEKIVKIDEIINTWNEVKEYFEKITIQESKDIKKEIRDKIEKIKSITKNDIPDRENVDGLLYYYIAVKYKMKEFRNNNTTNKIKNLISDLNYKWRYAFLEEMGSVHRYQSSFIPLYYMFSKNPILMEFDINKPIKGGTRKCRKSRSRSKSKRTKSRSRIKSKSRK